MSRGLAGQLRALVAARGLSGYALAQAAGLNRSTVNRFLAGESGLTLDTLDALCGALGLRLVESGRRAVRQHQAARRNARRESGPIRRGAQSAIANTFPPIGASARKTDRTRPQSLSGRGKSIATEQCFAPRKAAGKLANVLAELDPLVIAGRRLDDQAEPVGRPRGQPHEQQGRADERTAPGEGVEHGVVDVIGQAARHGCSVLV